MARDGKGFVPYSKASVVDYPTFVLAATGDRPVDVGQSAVQQALGRLRSEKFVWRAGRGAVLIEDRNRYAGIQEALSQETADFDSAGKSLPGRLSPKHWA